MLFERSEFIECFEKSWLRPLSSGRFRALSFDSVFFLAVQKENEWKGGLGACLAKEHKTIFSRKYLFISLISVTFAIKKQK